VKNKNGQWYKGTKARLKTLIIFNPFFPTRDFDRNCCFLFQSVEKEEKSLVIIKEGLNLFSLKEIN